MRYEEYKATPEAVWFSFVPPTWRATKMREVFSERNEKVSDKDYEALSVGKMGVVPQLETAVKTDNGDNRKLICKGDFAINSRSDRKGSSGISEYDGSASLIITVLKPHNELNGRFYHYLLRSHFFVEEFYRNGHGLVSDLWTTKWDEMRNIYIPVPPREEQDQIVRYLDWQVSKINKLIHGYQREIKLLEEMKTQKIDYYITSGVHSSAKTRYSGVPWIGDIPESWDVVKIKWLFKEDDARNEKLEYPLLSFSRKKGLVYYNDINEKAPSSLDLSKYRVVHPGQLLENRMQAWSGMFICVDKDGCVSPDYSVFNPSGFKRISVRYYEYVFRNHRWVKQFSDASRGIGDGFNRLYTPQFGAILTVLPPYEEQLEITDYLDSINDDYRKAEGNIQKEIDLLREYRTRLISDVVTGQMDVRGIVIPDYTPEIDVEEGPENEEINEEEAITDAE